VRIVDVIIPAYNAHDTIDKAIASVFMQNLEDDVNVRIAIVNDASDKDYFATICNWKSILADKNIFIKEIVRTENGGAACARQTGIECTSGHFIMFIDADDVLYSPKSIMTLLNGMNREDGGYHDMVMGNFLEELSDGTVKRHDANQVWLHGKMFLRNALELYDVKFNHTRECEDVGFNLEFFQMTDDIFYYNEDVYLWKNREDSTVRVDKKGYRFGYGWRSLIENTIIACLRLEHKNISCNSIVITSLCKFYFQFVESTWIMPEENENNRNKLREFYDRVVKNVEDSIDKKELIETFVNTQEDYTLHVIPKITFYDFLNMIKGK